MPGIAGQRPTAPVKPGVFQGKTGGRFTPTRGRVLPSVVGAGKDAFAARAARFRRRV